MTLSKIGRIVMALVATAALGLGMTACGGGTIGYLWVLGTYYNQISGFLIDDYTGNLTSVTHSPFASGGVNPVSLVVKPGGRFIFVINAGAGATGTPQTPSFASTGAGITVFSVGGGGLLTVQNTYFSQGVQPVWAALDSSGSFLYVVDKYSPAYCNVIAGCPKAATSTAPATTVPYDLNGSITAFSIAGDTGRLTLVPNTSILTNNVAQTYFEVGPSPVMTKVGGSGCLYTLSPTSIYPYSVNSATGQLVTTVTGAYQVTGATKLSSINTSLGSSAGSFTYLTDQGSNQIYSLQAGGTPCSLSPIAGSTQTNLSGTNNPMNSLTSSSGKFLYVLNQTNPGSVANSNSSISAFTINSLGQLAALSDTTNNPYAVGSGPVCIVQDPSNQYMYISNSLDSTITGKLLDQNRGYLSDLSRGSVFPTTRTPTCLAVSGNI